MTDSGVTFDYKTELLMLNPRSTEAWPWLSVRIILMINDSSLNDVTFICLELKLPTMTCL